MKANISKVSRYLVWDLHVRKIMYTEPSVVAAQQTENLRNQPALVSKLHHVFVFFGQCFEKLGQALDIHLPAWWELKQDGTKLLPEPFGREKELLRRGLRIFQFFHVS